MSDTQPRDTIGQFGKVVKGTPEVQLVPAADPEARAT